MTRIFWSWFWSWFWSCRKNRLFMILWYQFCSNITFIWWS